MKFKLPPGSSYGLIKESAEQCYFVGGTFHSEQVFYLVDHRSVTEIALKKEVCKQRCSSDNR